MPLSQRIWALLPAAGVGRRMGSKRPKQYLPLAGKCVLEHTLEVLCGFPAISGLVVAVAETDPYWTVSNLEQRFAIARVPGGVDRAESVCNGLKYLLTKVSENDWVLVHDAVRPCLGRRELETLVEVGLASEDGAILAVQVQDTIKRVHDRRISETVVRDNLWQAQTPQMFPLATLYRALVDARAAGVPVTDEAQAMEHAGYQPHIVAGRADNIKITRPEDLYQAEQYLQATQAPICV